MDIAHPARRPRLELLAAQYVLGTLSSRARLRLQRLAANEPLIAAAIADWDRRLAGLADAIPPVTPPPRVYAAIAARLGFTAAVAPSGGWWNRLAVWRGAAIASFAIAVVLGIALLPSVQPPQGSFVAALGAADGKTVLVATASRGDRTLRIRPLSPIAVPPGRSLELWVLPASGNPRSVGLVDANAAASLVLPAASDSVFAGAKGLAVSLEPAGGSPSGLPTGPILYSGAIEVI
jgi:anti-sigma-K factor RskA